MTLILAILSICVGYIAIHYGIAAVVAGIMAIAGLITAKLKN